jgi:2-succinyl-5-enolpyruvyl-6-hydroxy-3-cyclohexene-1-carboxylate synthase
MLWASVMAQTLEHLGLTLAILCPGSRSAPLTLAFVQQAQMEAQMETIPILDERSASFFALGQAKRTQRPVVLVCTSGTAGANFYPAVIEAQASGVPLLILTADRPPELHHCHAGQTIQQTKLFGAYPNWQTQLALPEPGLDRLQYLRQTLIQAWRSALGPYPGPVHLNCPFRDPLVPSPDPAVLALEDKFPSQFFNPCQVSSPGRHLSLSPPPLPAPLSHQLRHTPEGLIVVGPTAPAHPQAYCQAIAQLSQQLHWPVLADALNPLRNFANLNPYLINTYDLLLRQSPWAETLKAKVVLQLGELPTSKVLRQWLVQTEPERWVLAPKLENFDPLHGPTHHLWGNLETFVAQVQAEISREVVSLDYCHQWQGANCQLQGEIDRTLPPLEALSEPKLAWFLSQQLPHHTRLFVANSTPVRDLEWFWRSGNRQIIPYCNRGANGIDGTLSTALGMAHCSKLNGSKPNNYKPSVLLTGDLALLHDTNGFLQRPYFRGHLTIILINNNGGGIFQLLPIAQFNPPFEQYFATPQAVDFSHLCQTYGIDYQLIQTWSQLGEALNPLPIGGIRLLEVRTDRHKDATWRQTHLAQMI